MTSPRPGRCRLGTSGPRTETITNHSTCAG